MLGTAVVMFLLALNCCTSAGMYWVNLIDTYAAGWGLLIVAVLEVCAVSYIYGINRFIEDIEMMIGKKHWTFWIYWRACWIVITPLLLTAILIWSLATFTPPSYGTFKYPDWANAIGWLIIASGLVGIPVLAIWAVVSNNFNIFAACRAAPDWGPYLKQFRGERYSGQAEPAEALKLHAEIGAENPAFATEQDQTKM